MKKLIAVGLAGMLILSTLAGCSSDDSAEDNSTIKSAQFVLKDASLTAQVQEIDGNSLTVSIGGGGMSMPGGMGGGPDMDGEAPEDFGGEMPDDMDGELPDDMDGEAPEMPDGDVPDMDGEFNGGGQSEATLYISDDAIVEIESEDGETTSGSVSDIISGDSLSIIFGSDGEITGVTILSNSGFAMPEGSGETA